MISVDIKTKRFGKVDILRDITFEIEKGQTLCLLGPSGVGKTTLLRILAGLDQQFDGRVVRPDAMAMVFQEPTLLPWRTTLENITLVTGVSSQQALASMKDVGLEGCEKLFPNQLSLGQRRRLSLARAFSVEPELLILDEPFASLDEARISKMMQLTKRLIGRTDTATILVTHSQTEADALADNIIKIEGQPARLVG